MERQLTRETLIGKINTLKEQRRAVILAHNYQQDEVQDIADYVGDSFGLSRQAAGSDAEVIVFCGVRFMAESAAILSPGKTVLLPARHAGCPLADTITAEELCRKKAEHPQASVVCYVNSSAAVKAESDVCCTSANAVQVVQGIEAEEILFVPDCNLGHWISQQVDKRMILWPGHCVTHYRVSVQEVERVREAHPDAVVLVHPECRPEVVARADYVGSTSGILRYARESSAQKIIVGTEMGILHRLKQESPRKDFFLLSQGLICPNMKMTNLERVLTALETLSPRITVGEDVRERARLALERMLEFV